MLPEPEEEDAKAKLRKNEVKAKRILTDSIKDHMTPNVSKLKTPKEMFDSLTKLYESKNTSRKLTLRHQLRNVTISISKTVANYFRRILQIKDQLATIGDPIEYVELLTTTLNGFPSSWDPFVQVICARSKLPKFNKLWADCTQQEFRLISKSQKTNDDENQALVAQVKKRKKGKKATRRSLRNHATRRMHQISDARTVRRWDIMPHNVLLKMKRKRRSAMHMKQMLKSRMKSMSFSQ
jgi:hypothetical protein